MSSLLLGVFFWVGGVTKKLPNKDFVHGTRLWWCQKNKKSRRGFFLIQNLHSHSARRLKDLVDEVVEPDRPPPNVVQQWLVLL